MPLLEMIGKLQELCPQCYQKSLWFYRNYRKILSGYNVMLVASRRKRTQINSKTLREGG